MNKNFHPSRLGFTLVETITVLAIIVILSAVMVPVVKTFLPSLQLSGASKLMLNKIRQAQEEAIAIQVIHSVRFHTDTNPITYDLVKKDTPEVILETDSLPKGMSLDFTSPPANNEINFSSDGGPDPATDITLTLKSNSKTIKILPAGVITLQ